MGWIESSGILIALLIGLLATGMPVAFAFGLINLVAAYYLFGSVEALSFLTQAAFSSVSNVSLTAIPFFLLMGSCFVRSGLTEVVLESVEKMLWRLRMSASYVAVGGGAVFGALMGASIASTAVLGSSLLSEMRRRGYSKALSVGPILGAGTLSNLIPPSLGAVLIGSLAGISVGDLLIAGLAPALIMIVLFCLYIYLMSFREQVTASTHGRMRGREIVGAALRLAPLVIPILCVTGAIYAGIATPTEASATGAAATLAVTAAYGRLSWKVLKEVLVDTAEVSAMILLIVASSKAYSQILAITGISSGLVSTMSDFSGDPTVIVALTLLAVLILGCFMDQVSVIFVSMPLLVRLIPALGVDPVWFGVLFLAAVGVGGITPPFGLNLFILRGVAPADIRMKDIYRIAIPFVVIELVAMLIILLFPEVVDVFV